ncbi:2,3-diaminopropionate biosynthesis protein SbnA [Streptomyces diastaticus]|uniref:2,3-diaminopropionate biosynthesis protein SbnA n=1 Tax=Streptomyces diastaticus subsp. diastaticus TaxID=68040 RepID=A0ABQ1CSW8_STRDI|nr:2,3-diaminopropionate biosynthesis protein SbnA [Streptomyces diastaticus subsp. diastaticus]GGU46178.1 2,3-diaminopropionate biosynthesis protein SbnA [Streptomyces diastaticus subsp. diastaticus]
MNEATAGVGKTRAGETAGLRVVTAPYEPLESQVYVDLRPTFGRDLLLRVEGFNFAGSLKLRAAAGLVAAAEQSGRLGNDSILIESSSGNLGLALAMIAANKGLRFVCVTDPRCNPSTLNLLRSLGAELVVVTEQDANGGYLQTRLDYVRARSAEDSRYVWLNQYANPANWIAHYETTAPEIAKEFPDLDALFVGVGTAGTVTGCARYFRDNGGKVKVIAVDAEGSVSFGGAPKPRAIPGLGASVRPPLLEPELFADVVHVAEEETVRRCREMARGGFLFGGSTGTVLSGALRWLDEKDPRGRLRAVAIAPDLADRYADTVYDDAWVARRFGATSPALGTHRDNQT